MVDNVTVDNGALADYPVATDDDGTAQVQWVKLKFGGDGTFTPVTSSVGLPVSDAGGSLTVDGSVSITGTATVDTELTTADLDTGVSTDIRAVVGIVGSKSGGGVLIPGDATAGLKCDLGADNDVVVSSGTITSITNVVHVDDNASTISVDDGGGSLTVDGTVAATQSGTWTVQPGNTANTTAWKVDASSVAVPVTDNAGSLTVDAPVGTPAFVRLSDGAAAITTLPVSIAATQAVNVAQINGVTATMGNGVSGTGVQRVTLASDSTGQVALAAGSATIGALTANQSVNTAQINGVAPTMGNGVAGTGVQRVTLASDSTGQVALAAGSATIGALTANQSVNTAQINGVAPTMGNGASGTGVQRVTIANDSTGILATVSTVTTLSTLTGGGVAHDGVDSGNPIKVGGVAINAERTAVSTNLDRADFVTDLTGKQITLPYANPENFESAAITITSSTADTSLLAAAASGVRHYVTAISAANDSATATLLSIKDNTTVLWRTMVPAGGGTNITFPVPLRGTAATVLNATCATSVASCYVSVSAYKGV